MKKLGISLLLMLLVVMLICPAASAETENLGTLEQGAYVRMLLTVVYNPSFNISQPSDPGLAVVQEIIDGGVGLYLQGTPNMTGSFAISYMDGSGRQVDYYYAVTAPNNSFSTVLPAATQPPYIATAPQAPTVASSADVNCQMGGYALLTAAAVSYDGGALSYQWYCGYSPTSYGGSPVAGGNGPELVADTSRAGTMYYYCVVTSTLNGMQASATSQPIAVTVQEAALEGIIVNARPNKTNYLVGDTLDTTGLTLVAYLSNGDQMLVTEGFGCEPMVFNQAGEINVRVVYKNVSCNFPVTVSQLEAPVKSISVSTMPYKTNYKKGDVLDTSGLVCRVWKADNSYEDLSYGFSCSPTVLSTAGNQSVTLTYQGLTTTFNVSVSDTEKKLTVSSTPAKLKYSVGEALDTSGLVLKVSDGNGVQIVRSGFTCTPERFSSPGSQTVTVSYGGQSTSFTVTVVEAAQSTPAPGASPAVKDEADRDEEHSAKDKVEQFTGKKNNSSKKTVLLVTLVLCVIALVGLGAYMVYLRNYDDRGRRR